MRWHRISRENAAFQVFRALKRNRRKRYQLQQFLVEGVLPIRLSLESGLELHAVLVRDGAPLSGWARDVLEAEPAPDAYHIAPELMAALSDKDSASELMLVGRYPALDITTVPRETLGRILVLDRPASPGNLGAIVRTCDAFQIDAAIISGHGADPFDPKAITASRGTVFSTPVFAIDSNAHLQTLLNELRRVHGEFKVYGSSGLSGTPLHEASLSGRFCLIIGNETHGMNTFLQSLVDDTLRIEMRGVATSLNVACATAILLHALSQGVPRAGHNSA